MSYIIDHENNLYIIKIGKQVNENVFQKAINDILTIRNLSDKLCVYYTYFNNDASYCIIDFEKRNFTQDEIDDIVAKNTKHR